MPDRQVVMISSTARDLPEHREQVRLACIRAGFEPRVMMEHLTAEDTDPLDISLRMVEEANVYLAILAYQYGTIPDGHTKSFTEMEYDRAVSLNKPRLIFFIHKDHPVTIDKVDTGPSAEKLKMLKERIGAERVAAFFKSPEDLRSHVVEALTKLRQKLDDTTEENRASKTAAALHRATSIPAAPQPYIAHPYTLLQSRELIGRQVELNALTDWVTNPASPPFSARVFCFVAIGGMGKSALAWRWFNQVAPNEMKPLEGRIWWSFYESDATFENFVIRALCYVSGQEEDAVRALPWHEREAQLLQYLNERPYLFVLDGLERILIAYHRMDASYLADDQYDQLTANWVTGAVGLPPSAAQSFVGQHRLRQTTDPRAGALLQNLALVAKSRILITTRLYPRELQLPTGNPQPGSFAYFLPGLSDDDALGLWRALGVSGARVELVPIFRSIENHPLLVQALASEVANNRKAPGDFVQWRLNHPQFDPVSLPLVHSRAHILEFALDGLSAKLRTVLSMIIGFRMPASYAALDALLVGPNKACRSAQELDHSLTELEDRGLVGWDREANRYDVHPIVRGVVWQLINANDKDAIYSALDAHFQSMTTPGWRQVEKLEDLTPAIERYHTLVGLKRYDEAFALFSERLDLATLYRLAADRERIAWLEQLFPDGKLALKSKSDQSDAVYLLAGSYLFSGEPSKALPLFRRALDVDKRGTEALNGLASALFAIGDLRESVGVLLRALAISFGAKSPIKQAPSLLQLGEVFCAMDADELCRVSLNRSLRIFDVQRHLQGAGLASSLLATRFINLGNFSKASAFADRAWEYARDERVERDFINSALVQGRAATALGEFARSDERLHHALARARSVDKVEYELAALIAIAELEFRRGRLAIARTHLDNIWEAAERGPYPLLQADGYNLLAAIARGEKDKRAGVEAATKAFKASWCDGPPYAYHWSLQKAKGHLAALGAPEPEMPSFDESKFEPLPELEINPKDEYWVDPDKLD